MPPVSIIIPTYNRLGPVQRAIDSVLRQSFTDFELIVVDDGSTDATVKWLWRWQDKRLKIISQTHAGVAKARNTGALAAQSDWLCFLDSDDVWHRHKLSEQIRFHIAHPACVISQTEDIWLRNSVRVNKGKKHAEREGDIFRQSLGLCLICCSSVMLKKEIFFAVGGFDESLPTCEDYDLWLKILCQYQVGFVAKPLVTKFGGHPDQLSKAFPAMDRFRLQSLENLLQGEKISAVQKEWIKEKIAEKTKILNRS